MMIRFYNYDDLLHMNCDHFHIAQGVSSDAVSWPKRVRIWAAAPWYHFCQVRNCLIKFYSLLKTSFAAQRARHSSSHRQGRATQPQRARHRTQTPLHRWSSSSCWSSWSWSSWWLRAYWSLSWYIQILDLTRPMAISGSSPAGSSFPSSTTQAWNQVSYWINYNSPARKVDFWQI